MAYSFEIFHVLSTYFDGFVVNHNDLIKNTASGMKSAVAVAMEMPV